MQAEDMETDAAVGGPTVAMSIKEIEREIERGREGDAQAGENRVKGSGEPDRRYCELVFGASYFNC